MVDEDESAGPLRGFFEAASDFERLTKVKMMDDAALLHCHRALSNPRALKPSRWLDLVDREVQARGLRASN